MNTDKRIKELAEQAKRLQKELDMLAALEVCHRRGHDWMQFLTPGDNPFTTVVTVVVRCKRCGTDVVLHNTENLMVTINDEEVDLTDVNFDNIDKESVVGDKVPDKNEGDEDYTNLFKKVEE
jgi:hypothetical protein